MVYKRIREAQICVSQSEAQMFSFICLDGQNSLSEALLRDQSTALCLSWLSSQGCHLGQMALFVQLTETALYLCLFLKQINSDGNEGLSSLLQICMSKENLWTYLLYTVIIDKTIIN